MTRRLLRDKNNPPDSFSDKEIMRNCRLNRGSIYELCETLQADLERSTNRSHAFPVSLQNIIALRYLASGSYMNVIGDAQ